MYKYKTLGHLLVIPLSILFVICVVVGNVWKMLKNIVKDLRYFSSLSWNKKAEDIEKAFFKEFR